MKSFAKLIHQSYMTYFPTRLPVQFYGLPDGKVYIVYARFYQIKNDRTDLEYVLAVHDDFSYDFETMRLIPVNSNRAPIYNEMVDNPDPNFTILEVRRDIDSYHKAIEQLKKRAEKLYSTDLVNFRTETVLEQEMEVQV